MPYIVHACMYKHDVLILNASPIHEQNFAEMSEEEQIAMAMRMSMMEADARTSEVCACIMWVGACVYGWVVGCVMWLGVGGWVVGCGWMDGFVMWMGVAGWLVGMCVVSGCMRGCTHLEIYRQHLNG